MRVHHLNCGTMHPWGGRLISYAKSDFGRGRLVCHCLLIETDRELVLVDTGFGTRDITTDYEKLTRRWLLMTRPELNPSETAVHQVAQLGYRPEDVRHIVLTHLDRDHIGGLPDFPHATVHLHDTEFETMQLGLDRGRYLRHQWAHGPHWSVHSSSEGEKWFGFEAVRDLPGLPPEILLVPLFGHTRGHTGVAVRTGDRWLLDAGDAYFAHGQLLRPQHAPPALRGYERLMQYDGKLRRRNQERLRDLATAHPEVDIFCAHDPVEFQRYQITAAARSARSPR
ncbi:MBL fold metallo-hydrolase [Saccharopolyspora rectivirgula]|jgi:glyoxylase-like metal-dependent hydrolase (beta-lactamase superfamily II)|uniref:Beta-lactamase n=1 Tax=Saccharopolyspora rectivirgula TaxID=28042 RepID=A0A073B0U5_9PSEU|nr:MBL fold metallo-hydrolase [Saccharopolyspora rectivirgula]KEI44922.1 beta-lactamase [Saccharopolyspora rectivirgula]